MERLIMDLNREELELIADSLNSYWHQTNEELMKTDLGDIERKQLERIREKVGDFLRKLL